MELLNWALENKSWFLSGLGPTLLVIVCGILFKNKHSKNQDLSIRVPEETKTALPATTQKNLTYAASVGERMRFLRENILQLSLREMAEFFALDSVTSLEKYEHGEQEYPLPLLRKFEDFFSISQDYIGEGDGVIFERFNLSRETVRDYMIAGFSPLLLCCPTDREDLFCYQVFRREVDGYIQLRIANVRGSFASSGGGRMNITYMIESLLEMGLTEYNVRILKVSPREWERIEDGTYYNSSLRFGFVDTECQDIFLDWFAESHKNKILYDQYRRDAGVHIEEKKSDLPQKVSSP